MKTLMMAFILIAVTVVAGDTTSVTNQTSHPPLKSLGKEGDERRAAFFLEQSNFDPKANTWLMDRFQVAKAIKIGSTYAELSKHFYFDGGPNGGSGNFRCVMISCSCIKIDVELADKDGNKIKGSIYDNIPADACVTKISKPYLEEPLGD
jgi:hypothetical protein